MNTQHIVHPLENVTLGTVSWFRGWKFLSRVWKICRENSLNHQPSMVDLLNIDISATVDCSHFIYVTIWNSFLYHPSVVYPKKCVGCYFFSTPSLPPFPVRATPVFFTAHRNLCSNSLGEFHLCGSTQTPIGLTWKMGFQPRHSEIGVKKKGIKNLLQNAPPLSMCNFHRASNPGLTNSHENSNFFAVPDDTLKHVTTWMEQCFSQFSTRGIK